jgi:hypothetical protein
MNKKLKEKCLIHSTALHAPVGGIKDTCKLKMLDTNAGHRRCQQDIGIKVDCQLAALRQLFHESIAGCGQHQIFWF